MQDQIEGQQRQKRIIRFLYLLFFSIIISLAILFARGPYISNILKKAILPELETALQQKVIAKKIYINIFPLFIEARDLKVFDEDGTRILFAERVKGYIEPLGLLQKRISIHRLVVKRPSLSSDRQHLAKTIDNVKAYLQKESKFPFKVRIKVIEVSEASASLHDQNLQSSLDIKGLRSEVIFGKTPKFNISSGQFDLRKNGLPEFTGDVTAALLLRENVIDIKRLTIGSYGSKLQVSGLYSDGSGNFKTKIALFVNSVKRILNLRQKGEGAISAEGEVRIENLQNPDVAFKQWDNIFVDLRLKGDFYIQTLMEILKVKEKVEGLTDFQGEIKGKLSDVSGEAKAKFRNGNLFGVEVDSLRCNVTYKDGFMRFTNGEAELYDGRAKAEASIDLPHVSSFTLDIKFDSVDSKDAFKLIGWDPGIPTGKVKGELLSAGNRFSPDGWFVYEARRKEQESTENVLDRIKDVNGTYSLRGDLLSLSDLRMKTPLSDLRAEGIVDIAQKTLDFTCKLNTKEVSDLVLPYYAGLKGQGTFSGMIRGTFDSPEMSGKADISNAFVENYNAYRITSQFSYNKNLLKVQELLLMPPKEEHRVKGRIFFPDATKLFEFSKPIYEMNATVKNADLKKILQIFSKNVPAEGRTDADVKIGSRDKDIEISGTAHIMKSTIYKIPIDSASMVFSYLNKELSFKKVILKQGISTLTAEGNISSDERFFFRASSDKLLIKDLGFENIPELASISVQSEGRGTLKDPVIELNAKIIGGLLKGKKVGDGLIKGEIRNKNIFLNASFFDDKIKVRGEGHLDDTLPWNAEVEIQPGRYDFLLGTVFKDIPEDLVLNLKGHVQVEGNRHNVRALASISSLTLELLDYSLTNDSDIRVQINNSKISFPAFSVRSGGTALVHLRGDVELGREYNLRLEGKSSLSPLKVLSRQVDHLTGAVDFNLALTGKWEKPEMSGDLDISNASFGLRGNYPRISSINGGATVEKDRVIIKKLTGKLGGGSINVSGLLNLKALSLKGFYFESNLDNITASLSKDFYVNFKGNLLYKGTPDAQGITGDIKMNSARYKERIDWKRWLFMAKTKERPKVEVSALERADLNIRISGEDNISIDNNIAKAPVTVDIVLRGTISRPILFGTLESKEGIAYFRNNEFRIIHASAYFADPNRLNPVIELTAETSTKGYNIKLNLDGQIEHFTLSLSSDPPLEEMDILALLTVGQLGKETKGLKGGVSAQDATSFLAGELQDVFEERLTTITGLDRFQVGPYVSKTTGTVEPMVSVSKRLFGDRLYVTYSSAPGSAATEQQIFKLEYLLDKNISLIGSRDERGITGGDIKFRFEFK